MRALGDYSGIVGAHEIGQIRKLAKGLGEKTIAHVSSTFYGGGVSETLSPLIALLNDAGVKTEWRLFRGSAGFFSVTKKIHNALQGDGRLRLSAREKGLYEETALENVRFTSLESYDCVVVHDPQPLPLVSHYPRKLPWMFKPFPVILGLKAVQRRQPWVWRCHVDMSSPNRQVRSYLRRHISKYDAIVASMGKYRTGVRKPHFVIRPAIDPLSPKNIPMKKDRALAMLEKSGIETGKPIVAQVSRFDPWKDPLGVIESFRLLRKKVRCQLVLLGNSASDDPQGDVIFRRVILEAENDRDITVLSVQSDELVNAVQTASHAIIQKSLREGFGLTASEALWKGTPVVAGNAGGLPLQVIDGQTGFLVNSPKECATRLEWLLLHPKEARAMGAAGREHVRKNFLITRLLKDELALYRKMTGIDSPLSGRLPPISAVGREIPRLFGYPVGKAAALAEFLYSTMEKSIRRE